MTDDAVTDVTQDDAPENVTIEEAPDPADDVTTDSDEETPLAVSDEPEDADG